MSGVEPRRVDLFASEPHYLRHLAPLWAALGDDRGEATVPHALLARAAAEGIEATEERRHPGPRVGGAPCLVAGYKDHRAVRAAGRPVVYLEHGAGQAYPADPVSAGFPGYSGGRDHEGTILFLTPGWEPAERWQAAYPEIPAMAVGCPKLDRRHAALGVPRGTARARGLDGATVAISFHFDCALVPETRSAWRNWEPHLRPVVGALRAAGAHVLGHAHPRLWRHVAGAWRKAGAEPVGELDEVLDRADVFVADNTCVAPHTPVLCADLTWRLAGSLLPGDRIIACDEYRMVPSKANAKWVERDDRRFRTAEVTANPLRWMPSYRVVTAEGEIQVSANHPWLARRPVEHHYMEKGRKPGQRWAKHSTHWHWEWVETKNLRPSDQVAFLCQPWEKQTTWDAGWLAGMLDGEGCLHVSKPRSERARRATLSVAQNEGPVLDELRRVLAEEKLQPYARHVQGGLGDRTVTLTIGAGRVAVMRLLGSIRPVRLLAKACDSEIWDGTLLSRQVRRVEVLGVHAIGIQRVSALATTTRTFIAGGFIAHNSALPEAASCGLPLVWVDCQRYRRDVWHGGRFYAWPEGQVTCRQPEMLPADLVAALADPSEVRASRQAMVDSVYVACDGRAAERAADEVRRVL